MSYRPLTQEGIKFINQICNGNGNSLLVGKNKYLLPYSTPSLDKIWTAKITFNGIDITTNSGLGTALISWFNYYSEMYGLDANVIAAQAYAESNYVMWQYTEKTTASGISQFTMLMVFGIIVKNEGNSIKITEDEISKITNGLTEPLVRNSYDVYSKTSETAYKNRPYLHQNVINNPEIMIKAQCRYMKTLSDTCGGLASSSLFCYKTDKLYASDTFSKTISRCKNKHKNDDTYNQAAYDYVLKVFGILGDVDNKLPITGNYKPRTIYFGYDKEGGGEKSIDLKLFDAFKPFNANVTESDEFNLTGFESDDVAKKLSKEPKYTYIYYPESGYFQETTNKNQVVLHHTVSGDNVAGDIKWWESKATKVATAFIVGRRGEIFQLFSTSYWAYHLGISDKIIKDNNLPSSANKTLNQQSIGVEIDAWGGLIASGGYWYPATSDDNNPQQYIANTKVKPIENVILYNADNGYPNGFHGFFAFERYTTEQIESVKLIIQASQSRYSDIKLGYVNDVYPGDDMWGTYSDGVWHPVQDALTSKPGIWTHVSYRFDKSDCHPQPELIEMLKSL